MSPKELLIEETYDWRMTYVRPCLQSYTAIIMFQETTDELSMKSCKS